MSSGERPIGAAKGTQSDTEAFVPNPPPPPPASWYPPPAPCALGPSLCGRWTHGQKSPPIHRPRPRTQPQAKPLLRFLKGPNARKPRALGCDSRIGGGQPPSPHDHRTHGRMRFHRNWSRCYSEIGFAQSGAARVPEMLRKMLSTRAPSSISVSARDIRVCSIRQRSRKDGQQRRSTLAVDPTPGGQRQRLCAEGRLSPAYRKVFPHRLWTGDVSRFLSTVRTIAHPEWPTGVPWATQTSCATNSVRRFWRRAIRAVGCALAHLHRVRDFG